VNDRSAGIEIEHRLDASKTSGHAANTRALKAIVEA